MKKILTICIALVALTLGASANAQKEYQDWNENKVRLDRETIERGYTISDDTDSCMLGIFPDVFHEPSSVRVAEVFNPHISFPQKNRISNVCVYNISMENPYVLDKPIIVSLKYFSENQNKKVIHFFDRTSQKWKPLPTEIDYKNQRARAKLHFPFSYIAVFEVPEAKQANSNTEEELSVNARGAVVIDAKTGKVLFEQNANEPLQMASLTKLMTAYTTLEYKSNLNEQISVESSDLTYGAKIGYKPGELFSIKDILYGALVRSGNDAARTLARASGLSYDQFVAEMNTNAKEMGLNTMQFEGVTGLERGNITSALDYAKFSKIALNKIEMLQASTTKHHCLEAQNTDSEYCVSNTNKLLWSNIYITGGKTGYLPPEDGGVGSSLMVRAKQDDREIIAVLIGSPRYRAQFGEVEKMVNWTFANTQE